MLEHAQQQASLLAAQCVEADVEDILRAWGFFLAHDVITEADVMTEEESEAAIRAAFGV